MPDLDEVLERLVDEAVLSDEHVSEIREAAEPKWFREKADGWKKQADEGRQAIKDLADLQRAPKVEQAFKDQGVDWDDLKPLELQAAQAFKDFEDEEKLTAYIEHNDLPTLSSPETPNEPGDAVAEISKQAQRSGRDRLDKTRATVTPHEASTWKADKWARFESEHPELAQKVLQGEEVPVAFS